MFLPRPMVQLAAAVLAFFALIAFFLPSHSGFGTLESAVGSRYVRLDSARLPPPEFNHVRPKVDIDEPADDPIWDTQNRTLGFQKIYAISMPHRSDKRDYLALMALLSDLDIQFVDGVNGSAMHQKEIPAFWKGAVGAGAFGCWRAHMNTYQDMLQNKIQTALIIEDDADWDILLKPQMLSFARGVRALQDSVLPLHSPYGDSWNVLTLGNLGVNNKWNRPQKYYITPNDPTVIAEGRRIIGRRPDVSAEKLKGDYTRIVMEVNRFTGTGAYAISLRGAARMLFDQTVQPNAQAIDLAMAAVCRHDNYWDEPFCYGAWPPMLGLYRAIGPVDKDSDRGALDQESEHATRDEIKPAVETVPDRLMRKKGESKFTVYPVSLNMLGLLKHETKFRANDPAQDMMEEIDISTFEFPRGELVTVQPEEYADKHEV